VCNLLWTFTPSGTGSRNAAATINSDANGVLTSRPVALSGNGVTPTQTLTVTPSPLVFPDTATDGTVSTRSVTVKNTGGLPVDDIGFVLGVAGDANPSEFIAAGGSDCNFHLDYNQSCSLGVRFTPTAAGHRSATLRVLSNSPASTQPISLSG